LPPVSRKLAQCPPWMVRASTVFMARPAPFTSKQGQRLVSSRGRR
jgi:hypothetical protein